MTTLTTMASLIQSLPSERDQRWRLLDDLFLRWLPSFCCDRGTGNLPGRLDDTEKRLGLVLPSALKEWYCGFGALGTFWSKQDAWLVPESLSVCEGVLIFYVENQSVVRWGVRLDDFAIEDPPVVIDWYDNSLVWPIESPSVSEFAIQMFCSCLKWSSENQGWANGLAPPDAVAAIEERYVRLPLRELHWPTSPTYFVGDSDTLAELNGRGDDCWLWIGSRTTEAFRRAQAVLAKTSVQAEARSDDWPRGWTTYADEI